VAWHLGDRPMAGVSPAAGQANGSRPTADRDEFLARGVPGLVEFEVALPA